MASEFREWLSCPDCDGSGDVGVLAHGSEMVLECYDCGRIADFTLGNEVPFHGINVRADESERRRSTD